MGHPKVLKQWKDGVSVQILDKPPPPQSPTSVIPLPFSAHPQRHNPSFTAQGPHAPDSKAESASSQRPIHPSQSCHGEWISR